MQLLLPSRKLPIANARRLLISERLFMSRQLLLPLPLPRAQQPQLPLALLRLPPPRQARQHVVARVTQLEPGCPASCSCGQGLGHNVWSAGCAAV